MTTANDYAKQYKTVRRTTNEEQYNLILFPDDNTISVVKKKCVQISSRQNFVTVSAGNKKYQGIVLHEGDFIECSEAADRQKHQEVNPDIESDYERDSNRKTKSKAHSTNSTISKPSLTSFPFKDQPSNNKDGTKSAIQYGDSTEKQSVNDTSIDDSVTIVHAINPTTNKETIDDQDERTCESSSPVKRKRQSSPNDSRDRRKKSRESHVSTLRTFDDESSIDSEVELDPDENRIAPSFNGRRIAPNKEKNSNSSIRNEKNLLQDLCFQQSKLESRYLQPLNISIQRQFELLKEVLERQKKIIRGLRRRAINIESVGTEERNNINEFKKELIYVSPDGTIIDLLRREAAKDAANKYVTWLVDVLFKSKELISIQVQDVPADHRYQLIKDAVQQKFHLQSNDLDQIWPWLHTVILAKRRTLISKEKKQEMPN